MGGYERQNRASSASSIDTSSPARVTWLDAAQKLTMLLGDEHDKLFELQQIVANLKVGCLEEGTSSVEAKTRVEATDAFRSMQKQKAKIGRIEEMVRIAKIQARMLDNENVRSMTPPTTRSTSLPTGP